MASILYISHGGGPLPLLQDPSHFKMIEFMKALPSKIVKPEAIVVFSAHWEENGFKVQSSLNHDIVYDYYGFPKAAYDLKYPCQGNPDLAQEIYELIRLNNLECMLDSKRSYDHGSYIPLMMMYPNADVPVIQVSLNHNLSAEHHLMLGRSLRALKDRNILFIGSGFSFHNMRAFDFSGVEIQDEMNNAFQDSLIEICCNDVNEDQQWDRLIHWADLPNARYCHPREEHLLPLHVCAGLASDQAQCIFDDYILGKRAVAFLWTI